MLSFLHKKNSKLVVSLGICENVVQMAVLKEQDVAGQDTFSWSGKNFRLVVNDEAEVEGGKHTAAISTLLDRYEKLNLKGAPTQVVVSNALIEQVSIDKPDLPDEDIPDALQWSLKDLVKIPSADVVADYYDPPVQVSGSKKIYVVAISKKRLLSWLTLLIDRGLHIEGVVNQDMALSGVVPAETRCLVLSQNEGEQSELHVFTNQKLIVTRKLSRTPPLQDIKTDDYAEVEALALELQRSQDFFSGQLRQAPLTDILIAARHPEPEKLGEVLAAQLGLQSTVLAYPEWANELKAGDYSDLAALSGLSWLQFIEEQPADADNARGAA